MKPEDSKDLLAVVVQAQQGQQESLQLLAQLTEPKVYTYIYRTTLDHHLSQDLCQETLLQLVRSLPKTEMTHEKGFWAWLYRIAQTKIQQHFRVQGNKRLERKTQVDTDLLTHYEERSHESGLDRLIKADIMKAVTTAMNALSCRDRSILTLRCFDDLSYQQIATVMGVTQLTAKVAFFRAKQSLKRQLQRNGHGPSFLLSALGVFALMTGSASQSTHATTLVQAGTLKVGAAASTVGWLTLKPLVTVVVMAAVGFGIIPVMQCYFPQTYDNPQIQSLNELIAAGLVSPPTTLVSANYSHEGGWQQSDLVRRSRAQVIQGDAVIPLLDPRNSQVVVLRYLNSIEVGFGQEIVDGPGPDIYVGEKGCKNFYLYVTDGQGQEVRIAHHPCDAEIHRNEHQQYRLMEFDLTGYDFPFTPKAIRLEVVGSSIPGHQLHALCARIKP